MSSEKNNQEISNEISIAEMLCAKFYHDMSGSITAIDNSIEFLNSDNEEMRRKALELISSSSSQSTAKLIYYRRAYGTIKYSGDSDLDEIKKITLNFLKSSKIDLEWFDSSLNMPEISLSNKMTKVLMNFIIYVSPMLVLGGKISVNAQKNKSKHIEISINISSNNQLITNDNNIGELNIDDLKNNLSTKNIQTYYMLTICKEISGIISLCAIDKNQAIYKIEFAS